MPKIVSFSVVSSSDHAEPLEEKRNKPLVYYCLCSHFLLVIDADLQEAPRRRTDNAMIVPTTQRAYKLAAEASSWVIVKRENGYEKQHRYHCPRCGLWVAYNAVGKEHMDQHLYIVDSALTKVQGEHPPNAVIKSGVAGASTLTA